MQVIFSDADTARSGGLYERTWGEWALAIAVAQPVPAADPAALT